MNIEDKLIKALAVLSQNDKLITILRYAEPELATQDIIFFLKQPRQKISVNQLQQNYLQLLGSIITILAHIPELIADPRSKLLSEVTSQILHKIPDTMLADPANQKILTTIDHFFNKKILINHPTNKNLK